MELSEAITKLRAELIKARDAGRDDEIQFPVESLTLELRVAATRSKDGTAGFRVPIVNAGIGGSLGAANEQTQTVTIVFGSPLDRHGRPTKIARPSEEVLG
jgi:hypothetical protein